LKTLFSGESSNRVVKSVGVESSDRVSSRVDYLILVPKNTNVSLISGFGESIKVSSITGRLYVRNFRGTVEISSVDGPIQVDSINANVQVTYKGRVAAGSQIMSVNGDVEVHVPTNSRFGWVADTMKGDILAGFPVKGKAGERMGTKIFEAVVNGPGGPVLRASTVTGKIYLLPTENPRALAKTLLPPASPDAPPPATVREDLGSAYQTVVDTLLVQPPSARNFSVRKARIPGNYNLTVDIGANVFVGQVDGNTRLLAAGGEVVLGKIGGTCFVRSGGGPVNVGDVAGEVDMRTDAGDVLVRSARKGGRISTGGGSVTLLYAGGPTTVESGGGDVSVSQASDRISASTRSGDIRVSLDPQEAVSPVELRTSGGDVVVELPKNAKADIDAVVMTSPQSAHKVESDFAGLTTVRERVGDRVRIHATGKINGGGALITLSADNGNVQIRRMPDSHVVLFER
jgi:DUF4097 and DUF4098 domain-containing protein YvlB